MKTVIITRNGLNIPFEKIAYLDSQTTHIVVHLNNGNTIIIKNEDVEDTIVKIVKEYNAYYGKKQILHN